MIEQAVVLVDDLDEGGSVAPAALSPVGGPPFLALLVSELRRYGLNVLVVAGASGDQVAASLAGDDAVRVHVAPGRCGTGGALRSALAVLPERFLLLDGASLFDFNLLDLGCVGKEDGGADAVLALRHAGRQGTIRLDGSRITGFGDQAGAGAAGFASGGVALLSRSIVEAIPADARGSIERELCSRLAAGGRLLGRCYDAPFVDVALDPARARRILPEILRRGAVIFDRDGVLNEDVGFAHRQDQIRWVEGAIAAVKAVNDAGLCAFVATNQSGVARGFYEEEHVVELHRWMNRRLRAAGAHIDAFAFSPFHPDGVVERYRRLTDCRKPGPRMLVELMESHGIDRDRAVMVGDKQSDLAAADAAGIEGLLFAGGDLSVAIAPIVERLRR